MNILEDKYRRLHTYLRVSLTEKCNLRCTYCMPENGIELMPQQHLMTADEVFQIAKVFVGHGVNKIRLTGGEPLVRKDFESIVKKLSSLKTELAITTNGILIDKYLPLFESQFDKVNISLDTLKKERFQEITRRDEFDRVMNNIQAIVETGIEPKINVVLMKGVNDDEILDFIHWSINSKVHIRFIEFMPFKDNQWDWGKGVSLETILRLAVNEFGQTRLLALDKNAHDTSKNYQIKGGNGTFGIISTVTNPFCDTCNRIRLTADGKLKNCLFSSEETDLLSIHRAGQNIEKAILDTVGAKLYSRAGMSSFDEFADDRLNQQNRSMIRIGG